MNTEKLERANILDRLQCIRLFAIDAEKYLAVQILALHYSITKKSILVTTLIGK